MSNDTSSTVDSDIELNNGRRKCGWNEVAP